uniref:Sperm protamine P1 n=1 Tax=Tokudaia muenninki TaxID=742503 RepID=A0A0S3NT88_9MURI|nr:protamine 1 [Tokudaia muenninki]
MARYQCHRRRRRSRRQRRRCCQQRRQRCCCYRISYTLRCKILDVQFSKSIKTPA